MRKRIIVFAMLLSLFSAGHSLAVPSYAAPQDACEVAGVNDPLICGTKDSNEEVALQKRIKSVLETVYLWLGIIAVIVIVIGGINYMTSTGEAEKIKRAKSTITYAIVGLIVTLAAFAITEFVIGALEGRAPEGGGTHAEEGSGGGGGGGGSEGRGSESEIVEVKSIQVMGISTLKKGEEYGFYTKIIPDYATNKTVTWASSDTSVATVSNTGRVKALKPGETTITATAHNGKVGSKTVKVPVPIEVDEISFNSQVSSVKVGQSAKLTVTIKPGNAEDKTITWSSSDNSILTVDDKGNIKGIKVGTVTVTAKTSNGKTATIKVSVTNKTSSSTPGGNNPGDNTPGSTDVGKDELEIHFVSIGGRYDDVIIIRNNGGSVLIDGGVAGREKQIVKYIKALGITKLDYMIGTHLDNNHSQCQGIVPSLIPVGHGYYPVDPTSCPSKWCMSGTKKTLSSAIKKGLKYTVAQPGTKFSFGAATMYFIGTAKSDYTSETNSTSIINILSFGQNRFMFTGDAERPHVKHIEAVAKNLGLGSLKVDMVKWPHHGNSNPGASFWKKTGPKYVIVPNNGASRFPNGSNSYTMSKSTSAKMYRLSSYKTIVLISDGKNITVETNQSASKYKR
ncbi:Ig-like domain-containing protein [Candidatus Saccharibacteria bacterium]|nr:Ig-like domain-containing protein [Candidatus Saccharibacteria bacterium]